MPMIEPTKYYITLGGGPREGRKHYLGCNRSGWRFALDFGDQCDACGGSGDYTFPKSLRAGAVVKCEDCGEEYEIEEDEHFDPSDFR